MNTKEIALYIARKEKGKKQVNIAQIKEIVGIVGDLLYKKPLVVVTLINYGQARAKRKAKQ